MPDGGELAEGVGGVFELTPGEPIAKTARCLAEAGYAQSGFHATMAGPIGLPDAPATDVEITRLTDPVELADFSNVYNAGWAITGPGTPMAAWLSAPGWSLYLARVDGRPWIKSSGGLASDSEKRIVRSSRARAVPSSVEMPV